MNVIQRSKILTAIVGDKNEPLAKRAVHLCWLLHLAGDSIASTTPLRALHNASLPQG